MLQLSLLENEQAQVLSPVKKTRKPNQKSKDKALLDPRPAGATEG